jgi:hypothetical protein
VGFSLPRPAAEPAVSAPPSGTKPRPSSCGGCACSGC